MAFFNKNKNGIPGKQKIYKTVEKYRRPGQNYTAQAEIKYLACTEQNGLVGVCVQSFDGIPWEFIARLQDIIELHKEGKIYVTNLDIKISYIRIYDKATSTIFMLNNSDIKTPLLSSIPEEFAQQLLNSLSF